MKYFLASCDKAKQGYLAPMLTHMVCILTLEHGNKKNMTEEEYTLILKETNCPDPFRVAALNIYRDIARGKMT